MTPPIRAIVVALLQTAIVLAVGGKLLYDRAMLPRVWVETAGVDPYLPIRGRYASLRLVVQPVNPPDEAWLEQQRQQRTEQVPQVPAGPGFAAGRVRFPVAAIRPAEDGLEVELLRDPEGGPDSGRFTWLQAERSVFDQQSRWVLSSPVAFFLPEHVADPTRQPQGTRLWAEVTVARKGPPRPIRLAVKRNGELEPL